jgi:hypothetical protein
MVVLNSVKSYISDGYALQPFQFLLSRIQSDRLIFSYILFVA